MEANHEQTINTFIFNSIELNLIIYWWKKHNYKLIPKQSTPCLQWSYPIIFMPYAPIPHFHPAPATLQFPIPFLRLAIISVSHWIHLSQQHHPRKPQADADSNNNDSRKKNKNRCHMNNDNDMGDHIRFCMPKQRTNRNWREKKTRPLRITTVRPNKQWMVLSAVNGLWLLITDDETIAHRVNATQVSIGATHTTTTTTTK